LPAWKKLFLATWKTFRTRFQYILDNLKRHKSLVESQANLLEFEQFQVARAAAERNFLHAHDAESKRRLIEITRKLSPANCNVDHEYAAKKRKKYPNTGKWLLCEREFKLWANIQVPATPLLWLKGIPGAGKFIYNFLYKNFPEDRL
jgi:hypothetical protein